MVPVQWLPHRDMEELLRNRTSPRPRDGPGFPTLHDQAWVFSRLYVDEIPTLAAQLPNLTMSLGASSWTHRAGRRELMLLFTQPKRSP